MRKKRAADVDGGRPHLELQRANEDDTVAFSTLVCLNSNATHLWQWGHTHSRA